MLAMIPGPTLAWVHDDEPAPGTGTPVRRLVPAPESLLADGPVRDFSLTGLFKGAPDLGERSREIFRGEFANRADADR
jgi:hypothetical protein